MVHKVKCKKLALSKSNIELAEKFSTYFVSNINGIRVDIEQKQGTYQDPQEYPPSCDSHLSSFIITTEQEIDKIIKKSHLQNYVN